MFYSEARYFHPIFTSIFDAQYIENEYELIHL